LGSVGSASFAYAPIVGDRSRSTCTSSVRSFVVTEVFSVSFNGSQLLGRAVRGDVSVRPQVLAQRSLPICMKAFLQAGSTAFDPLTIPPFGLQVPGPAIMCPNMGKPVESPLALCKASLRSWRGLDNACPSRSRLPRRTGTPAVSGGLFVAIPMDRYSVVFEVSCRNALLHGCKV
jgi:hypothetical protein